MTDHVDYHSWCPARKGCTLERCGKCPIVRSKAFRRRYLEHLESLEGEERRREEYREKRRQGVIKFRQALSPLAPLRQAEQAIIAAHPTLYADNIDAKTDAADRADPVPGWILRWRDPYRTAYYAG